MTQLQHVRRKTPTWNPRFLNPKGRLSWKFPCQIPRTNKCDYFQLLRDDTLLQFYLFLIVWSLFPKHLQYLWWYNMFIYYTRIFQIFEIGWSKNRLSVIVWTPVDNEYSWNAAFNILHKNANYFFSKNRAFFARCDPKPIF